MLHMFYAILNVKLFENLNNTIHEKQNQKEN